MEIKGKKALVVGLGKTGEDLCDFLLDSGASLLISEKRGYRELGPAYEKWKKRADQMETGGHTEDFFLQSDMIISSPGIPPLPLFQTAREKGIPVLSEIELASRFLKGKIIGVTGSNGKSTTTTLIHKILKEGGLPAFLAGNIGTPLIRFVAGSRDENIYVTELSSFQLDNIQDFRASTAVFLNVTPDHIDWHNNFENYYNAKMNLISGQKKGDRAILNREDPYVWAAGKKTKAEVHVFSSKQRVHPGIFQKDGWIILSNGEEKRLMRSSEIPLPGEHNTENVLASALVGYLFGLPLPQIRGSILSFQGLEHRLKRILSLNGIDFYNDSKATNVDAALKAIRSFKNKIILILGGKDKEGDFTKLREPVMEQVRSIVLLGEARDKIRRALNGTAPMTDADSMADAVGLAFSLAERGDTLLLSPACTSWDMYDNFEQRGKDFKDCALELKKKMGAKGV